MSFHIVPLSAAHVEAAARLASWRYVALRREVRDLPERYEDPLAFADRLARLVERGSGVAALDGAELVGFLGAYSIGRFAGRPAVLSPEWGHGSKPAQARQIDDAMLAEAARGWVARGAETHIICAMAHDAAAIEGWEWMGFGHIVCDVVRSTDTIVSARNSIHVRRAETADADALVDLDRRLHEHMNDSPVFLSHGDVEEPKWWRAQAADSSRAIWIAEDATHPVGFLIQGPPSDDACDLIVDPSTSSITGTYVLPDARGHGVAATLLAHAVEWARARDYARLATDFETANVPATRFWLRHFRPVVESLARTIEAGRHEFVSRPQAL